MIQTKEFAKRLGKQEGMDPEEIRELLRQKSRASLYFLSKGVLGNRDLSGKFHRGLCYQLQDPTQRRRLLEVPRGHLKTTIATRSKPIWRIIQKPDPPRFYGPEESFLLVMSSGELASLNLQAIEHTFENNLMFRWLFPEVIPEDFQKTIWNTQQMRVGGKTGSDPTIYAFGVGGKTTGLHVRGIIEDDLVDETIADSEIEVKRRIDWHQYAFPLLIDPARDWIDTIGNRWARKDVNGWIKENEPGCNIIHYKAIQADGTSLWPERFSLEKLAEIRATLGPYKFGCQYQNDPKDSESAAFMSSWLRYYQLLPNGNLVLDDGEEVKRNELFLYMVIDPAASPGNRSDRTAVVVTGVDYIGRIFILDAVAIRKDPYEALRDVFKIYEKWRPPAVGIEQIAFQKLLIQPLDRMAKEVGKWMPIREVRGSQAAGAKETRINQVVGETFASGRAFIRKEMVDFIDEYSWFPDKTTTRDLLDAYSLSDQMWVFRRGAPQGGKMEDAEKWAKAAIKAGRSRLTGY